MWNLTKEAEEKFSKCHLLPIHETEHEWELAIQEAIEEKEDLSARLRDELEEVKEQLLQVIPSRFIPYLENGTLNQPTLPKAVREEYLRWVQESSKEFEQILDAAYGSTSHAITYLPTTVQEVFAESLHDAIIERIDREGDTLHLYINTDGGFATKSHIHFIFQQVHTEETDKPIQVGQYLIYYELQKIDTGFAFRVLFDGPNTEWTLAMENMDAEYYYRPSLFTRLKDEDMLEETTLDEFVKQVNPDYRYWLITPDLNCRIMALSEKIVLENGTVSFGQNEMAITVADQRYIYHLDDYNPIQFIYTNVYEDPYADLNEPVPIEEIEAAALGNDLELQVRAWNTMYANPKELVAIINRVFFKVNITDENEMLVSVYANHFHKSGILTEEIIEKYHHILD